MVEMRAVPRLQWLQRMDTRLLLLCLRPPNQDPPPFPFSPLRPTHRNTELVSFSAPLVTAFGEVGLEVHGNADLEVLDLPLLVNVTGYVIGTRTDEGARERA